MLFVFMKPIIISRLDPHELPILHTAHARVLKSFFWSAIFSLKDVGLGEGRGDPVYITSTVKR